MKDDLPGAAAETKTGSSFHIPSSSFALPSAFILHPRSSGPVARELPRDAPAARAAGERPLQRSALHFLPHCPVPGRGGRIEVVQPHGHDAQIIVLVEG